MKKSLVSDRTRSAVIVVRRMEENGTGNCGRRPNQGGSLGQLARWIYVLGANVVQHTDTEGQVNVGVKRGANRKYSNYLQLGAVISE